MMRVFGFVLAVGAASLLVGCGGGGSRSKGGSSGTGVLSVTLKGDSGTASGPMGTAYTVVVYRSDGTEVDKQTVNLSGQPIPLSFTKLPAGTLHLHVGVATTKGGAEIGAVDTTFDGESPLSVPIAVATRETPTSVAVSPSGSTVAVGKTQPLYAAARNDSSGDYIPTASSDWNWTSDATGVATVNSTGLVKGVAVGNANVGATYVPGSLSASATVGVFNGAVVQGKWTVMVYMDAANNLYSEAPVNINQMGSIATNPNVRFVIQWKQVKGLNGTNNDALFSGTRRYLASSSATGTVKATFVQDLGANVDMGTPAVLNDFVTWAKAKYPADHYALVLWSHGGGWYSQRAQPLVAKPRAIIYDDETGSELNLPDVSSALGDGGLDILAYDACLMQGAESAIEFETKTKYIVGDEDDVPGPGYPYQLVFKSFVNAPDTATAALVANMTTAFVNHYTDPVLYKDPGLGYPIQLSAIDTSKVAAFTTALDGLSTALLADPDVSTLMPAVRHASTQIEPYDGGYPYYDLDQLAGNFAAQSGASAGTKAAATALRTAITNMVVANATDTAYYKGVSIDFGAKANLYDPTTGYVTGYNHLRLSSLTHWDDLLENTTDNP